MRRLWSGRSFVLVIGLALGLAAAWRLPRPAVAARARAYAGKTLVVFAGSASKPPTEEAAALFEKRTGATVELHFGGSGAMLSQMRLAGRGDLYFPGSSDFMELAKREKLVLPETERIVVYLVPSINVPKGNPKRIRRLEDLAQPGVRVGIARPDTVCVGLYGAEVLERAGLSARVRPNIVTHAESCEKTAQLVALGMVDAILGWSVFEHWAPDKIETILLPKERVPRIGYIPIALTPFAAEPGLAREFVAFLRSPEGRRIFEKWGYFTTPAQARRLATPKTPVGGEWELPETWK